MTRESGGSLNTAGIDDGFFPIECKELRCRTLLVSVLCTDMLIADVRVEPVTVDSLDGTCVAFKLVKSLSGAPEVIFTDGVTIAGFNVVDPEELYAMAGIPVVAVFKHELNLRKIREALVKHFPDWSVRYGVIEKVYKHSKYVQTPWRPLRISAYGIPPYRAMDYIIRLQNISPIPEPLRLADIIASGLTGSDVLMLTINKDVLSKWKSKQLRHG